MSVDFKRRFDRIVDILIQLQSKRIVRAKDLADRFDVSLRTIYRDIKSLEQAGVPIMGEAGAGYSLVDGYKLPPVVFTTKEALSFVAAEKLAQKFLDKSISEDLAKAMFKIKSVLKMDEKELVSAIENQIVMNKPGYKTFNEEVPHALSTLFESIAQSQQVDVRYQGTADNDPQVRTLEPLGLFHEGGFWYMVAYCLKRADYRQFRADRIHDIKLTSSPYSQKHMSISDFLDNRTHNVNKTLVRILVEKEMARYMAWERNMYGFVSEIMHEHTVEMTFNTRNIDQEFARWYMMFADSATIIEPASLKLAVKKLMATAMQKLDA